MSVYTEVETPQLEAFLSRYDLGRQTGLTPVPGGITNTNYFLETERGRYVLTLYEHHGDDELNFILCLQQHLATAGVHCAAPLSDREGRLYTLLNQRPAAIINLLDGDIVNRPGRRHCRLIGTELACFHLAGQDFPPRRANPRGGAWLSAVCAKLDQRLSAADRRLITATLEAYRAANVDPLPSGAIHADLFHDNALFAGNRVGIVDFDYACTDALVFDLAVIINDWCLDQHGRLQVELVESFIDGYRQKRPLERNESVMLPLMLRLSALRFWLSRLHDKHYPLAGVLTYTKDPQVFRKILALHSQASPGLETLFNPH